MNARPPVAVFFGRAGYAPSQPVVDLGRAGMATSATALGVLTASFTALQALPVLRDGAGSLFHIKGVAASLIFAFPSGWKTEWLEHVQSLDGAVSGPRWANGSGGLPRARRGVSCLAPHRRADRRLSARARSPAPRGQGGARRREGGGQGRDRRPAGTRGHPDPSGGATTRPTGSAVTASCLEKLAAARPP